MPDYLTLLIFLATQGRKGNLILDSTMTYLLLKSTLLGEKSNNWTLFLRGLKEKLLSVIQREEKNILSVFVQNSQSNVRQKTTKAIMVRIVFGWIWPGWTWTYIKKSTKAGSKGSLSPTWKMCKRERYKFDRHLSNMGNNEDLINGRINTIATGKWLGSLFTSPTLVYPQGWHSKVLFDRDSK